MKGLIIIQTVILFLITAVTTTMFPRWIFLYLFPILLGLISFAYAKKFEKKEILKVNIISSLIAMVLITALYFLFALPLQNEVNQALSSGADPTALGNNIYIVQIFAFEHMLRSSFIFLILFNLPFLVHYFFGNSEKQKTL